MHTIRYREMLCALALALAVFGMIGSASATSANTDVSDIWWNPNESGWGMQMVNTGTFVFATIYVYGPNGSPTWYTGQLDKTAAAQTAYAGPLFATTGPYFGSGSFNPNAVAGRQVGTMTFVLTNVTNGQLTYSVDGVVVNKTVQRQPLTLDNYSGNYIGNATYTDSGCFNPAFNGTRTEALKIGITQNGQSIALVLTAQPPSAPVVCSNIGTFSQLGRMGQVFGTYSCTHGGFGTVTFFEMNNVPYMFSARYQAHSSNDGCNEVGEINGLIPR